MSYIGDTMKLNIHEHRDSQFTNFCYEQVKLPSQRYCCCIHCVVLNRDKKLFTVDY